MAERSYPSEFGIFAEQQRAWDEVHEQVMAKDWVHFYAGIMLQLGEWAEHHAAGNRDKEIAEIIDIISYAYNALRWYGLSPTEVVAAAHQRFEGRYKGQTQAILDKYENLWGV